MPTSPLPLLYNCSTRSKDALSNAAIFSIFDEVEISLTKHLAPVNNRKPEVKLKKFCAIFVIPGVHIVRISRDISDHKRCQQVRLIALSICYQVEPQMCEKMKNSEKTALFRSIVFPGIYLECFYANLWWKIVLLGSDIFSL